MSCYLVRSRSAARPEAPTDSGRIVREVVARHASARAYGAAMLREADFIDVDFEEVREAPPARSLPRVRSTRALSRGEQDS